MDLGVVLEKKQERKGEKLNQALPLARLKAMTSLVTPGWGESWKQVPVT